MNIMFSHAMLQRLPCNNVTMVTKYSNGTTGKSVNGSSMFCIYVVFSADIRLNALATNSTHDNLKQNVPLSKELKNFASWSYIIISMEATNTANGQ